MKLLNILLAPIVVVGMVPTTWARDYKDLIAEGYRWVSLDGPFACPSKEDLRRITSEPSDTNELHMVEQVRAYYFIQGALVKVIQEDGSTGMVQIRIAGINSNLWTHNKFLSRRPIKNAYAAIETPETSGLISADTTAEMGGVQNATDNPKPSMQTAAGRNPVQLQHNVRPVFELDYR